MCLATAMVNRSGNETVLAKNISTIRVEGNSVVMTDILGEEFVVEKGERIAQLVLARHERLEWELADSLAESSRGEGGFGSTGTK